MSAHVGRLEMNVLSKPSISKKKVHSLFSSFLRISQVHKHSSVSVAFVSASQMKKLNYTYRQKNSPTDVLSFSDVEKKSRKILFQKSYFLGEIIICGTVALRQAKEYKTTFEQEVSKLLAHGMLHLIGYDHKKNHDAEEMEALENLILQSASVYKKKTYSI